MPMNPDFQASEAKRSDTAREGGSRRTSPAAWSQAAPPRGSRRTAATIKAVRILAAVVVGGCAIPTNAADAGRGLARTLRELTTDRPDATESPFTVDRDHLQLEMSVTSYTQDRFEGVRLTEWELAPFNLRYGIATNVEAGIFIVPHRRVTVQPRDEPKHERSGVGDTTLRMKVNFWGNDGGPTAFGMMVDVKLPTAANGMGTGHTDGALTFPIAYELGGGWAGAAMTSVEMVRVGDSRRAVWVNTITFARDLFTDTAGFLELTSAAGEGAHVATFNCGITRALGPRLQLDCGVNIGISRTAPDLSVFAGLARKF